MSVIEILRRTKCSFVTDIDLPDVIKESPTQLILVRTGRGRFLATADQVQNYIDIIEREKSDYIRDVSLFSGRIVQ
jgi:hypothetical protein